MTSYRKKHLHRTGGQAEVWEGERLDDQRRVAIKYLKDDPTDPDPAATLRRFERELRCQLILDHPHIAKILGKNTAASPPWYVMDWADGSLRDELAAGQLTEQRGLDLFRQILSAIEHAHAEGVLHRDLKPENILLFGGIPMVSDFGLSRLLNSTSTTLTMTHVGMGTLAYSAPEQLLNAHSADARADVYALGKMLFEIVTGRMPWPTLDASLAPARFRYVIAKATADKPEDRYQSVTELGRDLGLLLSPPSHLAPPLEQAQQLLTNVLSGDPRALRDLDRLLHDAADDEVLYKKFVPYLPAQAIAQYAAQYPKGLADIVKHFDDYAAGSHPFSYVDVIADFLAAIFAVLDDPAVKRLILARLLETGAYHNRWYVIGVFSRLLTTSDEPAHYLLFADVLRQDVRGARFVEQALRRLPLPNVIAQALPPAAHE